MLFDQKLFPLALCLPTTQVDNFCPSIFLYLMYLQKIKTVYAFLQCVYISSWDEFICPKFDVV